MIKLKCGTICHPKRGTAPEPQEGYEYAEKSKFIHVPILLPCEDRLFKDPECKNCGEAVTKMFCQQKPETKKFLKRDYKTITRMDCMLCTTRNCQSSTTEKQPNPSTVVDVETQSQKNSLEEKPSTPTPESTTN